MEFDVMYFYFSFIIDYQIINKKSCDVEADWIILVSMASWQLCISEVSFIN